MKKSIVMSLLSLGMCGLMNMQNASAVNVNLCVQNYIFNPAYCTAVAPVGTVYYIYDARGLNWVSYMVQQGYTFEGYKIELANDLDFYGIDFLPIGNHYRPFEGELDGKGYVIRNLNINYSENAEIGLVGCLGYRGVVQGVNLACSCRFNAYESLGGIVGYNFGIVKYCSSHADLIAKGGNVGGIVGYNYSSGKVEHCRVYRHSKISTSRGYRGRIIGRNLGKSSDCGRTDIPLW